LERVGAAVLLEEENLTGQRLADSVSSLIADPQRLHIMSIAARKLAHPDAARDIARMAAELARGVDANPAVSPT